MDTIKTVTSNSWNRTAGVCSNGYLSRRQGPHTRAFTLIELLVVIAIIALLLAMVMPALSAAKSKARRIMCLANHKQLVLAINTYVSENKDNFFPYYGSNSETSKNLWMAGIGPYIGNTDEVRICPEGGVIAQEKFDRNALFAMTASDLGVASKNGMSFTGNAKKYAWSWASSNSTNNLETTGSYCLNGYLYTDKDPRTANYLLQVAGGATNLYGKITQVSNRASVPMLADGIWPDFWPTPAESPFAGTTWSKGGYGIPGTPGTYFGRILINRHNYQLGIGFLDGHAQMADIMELRVWELNWSKNWKYPTSSQAQAITSALKALPK